MFLGIDLAADPRRTGLAALRDRDGTVVVEQVRVGADDELIIEMIGAAASAGIDVPLGWPQPFVELLGLHAAGTVPAPVSTGPEWRRELAMRATDREVHRRTGLTPLSVSTDRIAHPALRWAGIEAHLREAGIDTARDGSGRVAEVYPAAALRCWSLPHRGYKGAGKLGPRTELVAALSRALPWLDWNGHRELCTADDDALDAVLAALVAREVHLGRTQAPPPELRGTARIEGWIHLPRQHVPHGPSAPDPSPDPGRPSPSPSPDQSPDPS